MITKIQRSKSNWKKRGKGMRNLSENWLGQIGALKESDGLSAADPAVSVQIRSPEVSFELIRIRAGGHFAADHNIQSGIESQAAMAIRTVAAWDRDRYKRERNRVFQTRKVSTESWGKLM